VTVVIVISVLAIIGGSGYNKTTVWHYHLCISYECYDLVAECGH